MYCGPVENSHVENYKMALKKFPLSLDRKKWSESEKKNLEKGIRQQFQEMVLQNMMGRMRYYVSFLLLLLQLLCLAIYCEPDLGFWFNLTTYVVCHFCEDFYLLSMCKCMVLHCWNMQNLLFLCVL